MNTIKVSLSHHNFFCPATGKRIFSPNEEPTPSEATLMIWYGEIPSIEEMEYCHDCLKKPLKRWEKKTRGICRLQRLRRNHRKTMLRLVRDPNRRNGLRPSLDYRICLGGPKLHKKPRGRVPPRGIRPEPVKRTKSQAKNAVVGSVYYMKTEPKKTYAERSKENGWGTLGFGLAPKSTGTKHFAGTTGAEEKVTEKDMALFAEMMRGRQFLNGTEPEK